MPHETKLDALYAVICTMRPIHKGNRYTYASTYCARRNALKQNFEVEHCHDVASTYAGFTLNAEERALVDTSFALIFDT